MNYTYNAKSGYNTTSLEDIAYNTVVQTYGTHARDIQVDKKYKLMEKDGVNTIALGKCVSTNFIPGNWSNDFTQSLEFQFETNNDHPLLKRTFYGYNLFSIIINIIEDEDEEDEDIDNIVSTETQMPLSQPQ
jgi:hypothetical protein